MFLYVSNKNEVCKIDESVVQAHEGTFEDSIDSLGGVECDFKAQTSMNKDTKMEQNCEEESNGRKINEEGRKLFCIPLSINYILGRCYISLLGDNIKFTLFNNLEVIL